MTEGAQAGGKHLVWSAFVNEAHQYKAVVGVDLVKCGTGKMLVDQAHRGMSQLRHDQPRSHKSPVNRVAHGRDESTGAWNPGAHAHICARRVQTGWNLSLTSLACA